MYCEVYLVDSFIFSWFNCVSFVLIFSEYLGLKYFFFNNFIDCVVV